MGFPGGDRTVETKNLVPWLRRKCASAAICSITGRQALGFRRLGKQDREPEASGLRRTTSMTQAAKRPSSKWKTAFKKSRDHFRDRSPVPQTIFPT